ncbi:MAG TPA: ATPase domain-containing protein [Burkholderiales bacterium]|nr:ATPase domain-containing protein [Burkholderiales bacterium]
MISQQLCSTGVPGLDEVLAGGLPSACLHLIEGSPGVGKTTLAMQFLLEGKARGEACLYVSLSESQRELETVARSHGWDLGGISIIELSAIERAIGGGRAPGTLFHSADVELTQLTKLVYEEVQRARPQRVVLDSLSEMRLLAQSPLRYRREILGLKQRLGELGCTVLVLDDRSSQGTDVQVHSIVHGAISLEAAPLKYGIYRRTLSVTKVRGVHFREGNHDYVIETGGLRVFPRLVASEHHAPFRKELAKSGNAELDTLLGGGLHYGTSNLLIGPAGSGKTTIATLFAHSAAVRGERVNYYVFDETIATLAERAAAMGLDLAPHLKSGRLNIRQMDPAQISPGQLAWDICRAVEEHGTRVVVLDSLNGYVNAMPQEEFLHLHLHELLAYLNQQGVMTVMVLAQHGLIGAMGTPIDVSYLADSVIITRFFEALGAIRKAISIIKKRSGQHEGAVRELQMTAAGVRVGGPLNEFQGVLTGVPAYLGGQGGGALRG